MPVLSITEEQVLKLVQQLPFEMKEKLLNLLILQTDENFKRICEIGEEKFLRICRDRNIDPQALSEEEKMELIDQILHEDKA